MTNVSGYRKINLEHESFKEVLRLRKKDSPDYIYLKDMPPVELAKRKISIKNHWIDAPDDILKMYESLNNRVIEWAEAEAAKRKAKLDAIDAILED